MDGFSKKVIPMFILTLHDKYVSPQAENARLKRQLGKVVNGLYYWKEKARLFQVERDYYREHAQTQAGKEEWL